MSTLVSARTRLLRIDLVARTPVLPNAGGQYYVHSLSAEIMWIYLCDEPSEVVRHQRQAQ
jgi:hypothetical protein